MNAPAKKNGPGVAGAVGGGKQREAQGEAQRFSLSRSRGAPNMKQSTKVKYSEL